MDQSGSKAAFELLHEMALKRIHPDPSPLMRTLLTVVLWTCPVIGLLYLIGGMKRTLQTGFWIFRFDSQGYSYPNLGIVTPFWGCLYTIRQYGRWLSQVNFLPARSSGL